MQENQVNPNSQKDESIFYIFAVWINLGKNVNNLEMSFIDIIWLDSSILFPNLGE